MSKVSIDDIKLINEIARVNSFAIAANNFNISRSSLTRRLQAIESIVGKTLIYRSTRNVSLTEEGKSFVRRAQKIEKEWQAMMDEVSGNDVSPSGILRVAGLNVFNRILCQNALADFLINYPNIQVHISSIRTGMDLTKLNFDLVIGTRPLEEGTFHNEVIAESDRCYVASPEYLAKNGVPSSPYQISEHKQIVIDYPSSGSSCWGWVDNEAHLDVEVNPSVVVEEIDYALDLVTQGIGISWMPEFICRQYIRNGDLVELFGNYGKVKGTLWASYPKSSQLNYNVKLFIKMLKESKCFGSQLG